MTDPRRYDDAVRSSHTLNCPCSFVNLGSNKIWNKSGEPVHFNFVDNVLLVKGDCQQASTHKESDPKLQYCEVVVKSLHIALINMKKRLASSLTAVQSNSKRRNTGVSNECVFISFACSSSFVYCSSK